jgi:hypothetical protein
MYMWWLKSFNGDFISDSVNFKRDAGIIIQKARGHSTFAKMKSIKRALGACEVCGSEVEPSQLDVHHIRPLWSFAVEFICDGLERGERVGIIDIPASYVHKCNNLKNLMSVCKKCHSRIETLSDNHWKEHLMDRYTGRLFFDLKDAKKFYKAIRNV